MSALSIGVAFIAGLASFFSPCVLPIIPGFLAYLAGTSLSQAATKKTGIFINSLFFVLGFSCFFSLLGILLNSLLSAVTFAALVWLSRIGGVMVIFFGIYLTGIIRIPILDTEYKLNVRTDFKSNYITSFILGAAFAIGWTPCVGPILGGILALAVTQPGIAFLLLLVYSFGLGIPFLLVGLFTAPAASWINRYGQAVKYVNIIFGIVLIVLGILIFTQSLNSIAGGLI
jgi:cytochrome c-type biogenesis protein